MICIYASDGYRLMRPSLGQYGNRFLCAIRSPIGRRSLPADWAEWDEAGQISHSPVVFIMNEAHRARDFNIIIELAMQEQIHYFICLHSRTRASRYRSTLFTN